MLTLSIKEPQGYSFGSTTMSSPESPTGANLSSPSLCPPKLINTSIPRRPLVTPNNRRPKLSLQTSILPQPVSPALPLPCSADTPTTRNTIANSLRNPASSIDKPEDKPRVPESKATASVPYGPESTRRSILKNTPLTNLIRTRKEEKERQASIKRKTKITFVDEPQIIFGTSQDAEPEDGDTDTENSAEADSSQTSSIDDEAPRANRPRSDSAEWRRLRKQRAANEGRELRNAGRNAKSHCPSLTAETPISADHRRYGPLDPDSDISPDLQPQTPETPSPRHTRDWVWTLGDNFSAQAQPQMQTNPSSRTEHAQSVAGARKSCVGRGGGNDFNRSSGRQPPLNKLSTSIRSGGVGGGGGEEEGEGAFPSSSLPDTPSTATPVTPMTPRTGSSLPDTPVTPRSATETLTSSSPAPQLRVKVAPRSALQTDAASMPLTPRSVPLPETPKFTRRG